MPPICYLCGSSENLTRDHVPPKGFFPDPKPTNLISVPCCQACNVGFSADDEAFRAWIVAPPDVSPAGMWIRQKKVIENTFRRSPKLVQNINRNMREVEIRGRRVDLIDFPSERAERFLIRLTKGLLAYFHPHFPRGSQRFTMKHATISDLPALEPFRDRAIYDQRGDGVFQFRRFISETETCGDWLFCFYKASLFRVSHELQAG